MAELGEVKIKLNLDNRELKKLQDQLNRLTVKGSSIGPRSGSPSGSPTHRAGAGGAWARPLTSPMSTGSWSGTAGNATSFTDDLWWGYLKTAWLMDAKFHLYRGPDRRGETLCGLTKSMWPVKEKPHPVRQCKKCQAKFLRLVEEEYVNEG